MNRVSHTNHRSASIRLARAVSHLQRANRELTAATQAAPDRYHQNQLRHLAVDVRELSNPLSRIVWTLENGARQ